jgi:tetratricopeptide (TPR) repeat protein
MAKHSSLAVLPLFLCAACAVGRAEADEHSGKALYQQTLHSTVLVLTPRKSHGTGWLLDRGRKLVITNYHVVTSDGTVDVVFPVYRKGKVIAERSYYTDNLESLRKQGFVVRGQVLEADARLDLALIEVDALPEGVAELKLAAEGPSPGDRVHSVGNPGVSDALWVYTSGTVRQVYRKRLTYPSGQEVEANVVETQAPINPGDSGGPVVNDDGELVAVTAAYRMGAQLLSTCIEVGEVRTFVARTQRLLAPRTAADYLSRGLHHTGRGRLDRAIADYTEALRLDPKLAAAYTQRGAAYVLKGDYDQAIRDCTEAIRANPKDSIAYNNRGVARSNKGEYDQALADLTEATHQNPRYAQAFHNRGITHGRKGDHDRALADYSEAVRLEPHFALVYRSRGAEFLRRGELNRAIADFTEAVRLNPRDVPAYTHRGDAFSRKGDYLTAVVDYTESLRLDPKCGPAYRGRAAAYLQQGKADKAVADFTEAIRLNPQDADAYLGRSRAHTKLGDAEKARADAEKAAQLNPKLK